MNNVNTYIEQFGDYSFTDMDVNEVDALIFSQLAYTGFEEIVDFNGELTLAEAAEKFFELNDEETVNSLISISQKSALLLGECAKTKRFGNVIICHYINSISAQIDKQFCAVQFMLDNGDELVAFRGTDVTVTGLKESAMLSYMFPVPAQIEALYYFQETAMTHTGNIILCGHSKGGNLAVFAAVSCSNSLKKRIKAVYEYDSPGFPKHFFERYDYKEISDRLFYYTPQSSIIGRMLYHDAKPNIVHSDEIGIKQHTVSSWEVDGSTLVRYGDYDSVSDIANEYFENVLDYVSEDDLELFFDTLEYVAENLGVASFYDIKDIDLKSAMKIMDTIKTLDEDKRETFKFVMKKFTKDFAKLYFFSKKQEYMEKWESFRGKGSDEEEQQKDAIE
jgi:hypothetical protein